MKTLEMLFSDESRGDPGHEPRVSTVGAGRSLRVRRREFSKREPALSWLEGLTVRKVNWPVKRAGADVDTRV
jgi:hypothetical protein